MAVNKSATVYIIGGSGFIGRHLITKLLNEKYHVVNIDSFPFNPKSRNYQQHISTVEDCLQTINKLIKPNSIIYYLAFASVPGKEKDIHLDYTKSVKPFIDFMDRITELSPKVIFLSSAGAIYGENKKPNKENDLLNPKSIYGIHKLFIEKYLFYYFSNKQIEYRIARISNPYGNNFKHNQGIGFVDAALRMFKKKGELKVYGDLSNQRDFIFIEEVVEALFLISNFKIIPPNRVVNISYGKSLSLQHIIDLLQKKYGYKINLSKQATKHHDVKNSLVENEVLKKVYGFSPRYSIKKFLQNIK